MLVEGANKIATRKANATTGVWVFYVSFFALLGAEGAIVAGIVAVARWIGVPWLGVPWLGPWAAWLIFIAGGFGLGMFELKATITAQKMRDPVLIACCWLQRKLGALGYLVNAVVIGGSPGSAVALKQTGSSHATALTFLAALLFASVWVPLFVFLWR